MFFADVHYGIFSYYYTVQLYWNGLVPYTTIVPQKEQHNKHNIT